MTDQGQPAGWYHAEGDPPGTTRYWDGTQWQGGPQAAPVASGSDAPAVAGQQLASPGLRMAGRVIDAIIGGIVALSIGAASIDFNALSDGDVDAPGFGIVLAAAIFAILYDTLFVTYLGGTPGKLILGMRVAEADSGTTPPPLPVAAKRAVNRLLGLLGTIGSGIAFIIGLASLVMLFTDERHQTVMDKIAGTVVIKK
jgi:uncharacterized RDD family membrane protein YckC